MSIASENDAFEASVRRMYVDGVPVQRIRDETGITKHRLYSILERAPDGPVPLRRASGAPAAAAAVAGPIAVPPDAPGAASRPDYRASVMRRLWRVADRQVRDIGRRIGTPGAPATDSERDARALATLARTVRELATVDAAARRGVGSMTGQEDAEDDDAPPRDPELFRAALAQRIDQLRETGSAAPRPGAADGG
jgi:hypothetical protein